jgi:hypothetical protein
MDGSGVIAMDSGSSNGQRRRNVRWNSKAIAMGDGTASAERMAQWVADSCQRM